MSEAIEKIVVRHKVAEVEDEAHRGGWKVAYADFMTAMMAFFLLMWIVSTAEEQRLEGLADYFTPTLDPVSGKGGQGAFAGLAPETRGMLASRVKEQASGENDPVGAPNGPAENPWADIDADASSGLDSPALVPTSQPLYMPGADDEPTFAERQNGLPGTGDGIGEGDTDAAIKVAEVGSTVDPELLEAAVEQITATMRDDPDLAGLAESIRIEQNDTGLEIQILEQSDIPMFPLGATELNPDVALLVARVGATIAALPNQIVITGHTDATPFARDDYTNWELSTDRAHATRRALIDVGVAPTRFARVSGMAYQEPLVPEDPLHPSNRRISIYLMIGDG